MASAGWERNSPTSRLTNDAVSPPEKPAAKLSPAVDALTGTAPAVPPESRSAPPTSETAATSAAAVPARTSLVCFVTFLRVAVLSVSPVERRGEEREAA